ncbi:MAG: hypothetical protein AB7T06_19920 [Kofleriaceae bacterium]
MNYDADAGVGFGAIGTLTRHRPGWSPYRGTLVAQLFFSSEGVQAHELRWDLIGVGTRRLRVFGRLTYFSTVNRNYCGLGNTVTCDPKLAEAAAEAAGLLPDSSVHDDFVRRYYRVRFVAPGVAVGVRWMLDSRWSAFGQGRLSYSRSGTFFERGPYPGSLFAEHHPDGESGIIGVPQVGVMFDTRDSETTPSSGVWIEASTRAGLGTWSFAGGNLSARVYRRLGTRVVSATRVVADGLIGSPPVAELGLVNGAESYVAFGGQTAGRGIREHRYIGRIKAIAQQELRVRVSRRWVGVGFIDAGWVAVDWDEIGGDPWRILWGAGLGARFVVNPTFILRADVGFSGVEGWSPQVYLYIGHLY